MFLDNLFPNFIGAFAAPLCFIKRLKYPQLVSYGLLANLAKMRSIGAISNIDSIWDVGANCGQFAFMAHTVWPDLPIYSFEPDPDCFTKLKANFKKFSITGQTFCCAVGDRVESRQLLRYASNVNNSMLKSISCDSDALESLSVQCTTLNEAVIQVPTVNAAFLKLDVQGYELVVLAGAKNFLENCLYVQVEVSFSPTYSGGAHAGEILLAMREYGFECINILDLLRAKGSSYKIIEADLLFKNTNKE